MFHIMWNILPLWVKISSVSRGGLRPRNPSVVLDALSEGHSVDWILSQYPSLTADDVHAAVALPMGLGGAGCDTAITSF